MYQWRDRRDGYENLPLPPLPTTNLLRFNGKREDWPYFSEWFMHNIHNRHLAPMDKLSLLKQCLSGASAFPIVEPFQLHPDSYNLAWTALRETFDRGGNTLENRLILQLQRLPRQSDGTSREAVLAHIRKMRSMLIQLATMDVQHEYHRGTQNQVLEKLPSVYAQHLIENVRHDTSSTVHLLGVLDEKIEKELEAAEFVRGRSSYDARPPPLQRENRAFRPPPPLLPHAASSSGRPSPHSRDAPKGTSNNTSSTPKASQPDSKRNTKSCVFCSRHVNSATCRTVADIEKRKAIAQEKDLCTRCLERGHSSSSCREHCSSCNGAHHRAFCSVKQEHINFFDAVDSAMLTSEVSLTGTSGTDVKAEVIFDTGASISLITKRLLDKVKHEFISNDVVTFRGVQQKILSTGRMKKVRVRLQLPFTDEELSIEALVCEDPLTNSIPSYALTEADKAYIANKKLPLASNVLHSKKWNPGLLIEGDSGFKLMSSQILPPGLTIMHTRLGNLPSGNPYSQNTQN